MILPQSFLDVNQELLNSEGLPIYLQYSFVNQLTKVQISKPKEPVSYVFEDVPDEHLLSEPSSQDDQMRLRCVKLNKARVHYFFTESIEDAEFFLNNTELEFRVTFSQAWNKFQAITKAYLLNYFTDQQFRRGEAAHYSRSLNLFTEQLDKLTLRLTIGLTLDC